jgi:transketolase
VDTMRERFSAVVTELLDERSDLAVVLADIGVAAFRETGAIRRHPHRVINLGIREQTMVGVGAGLALEGFRPIVHSYAPFLVERAYEQAKLDLTHQGVGAILVSVGASHDAAPSGRTHQSPADVAVLAALDGWEIAVPGHPDEVEDIVRRVVRQNHNVYVRLARTQNSSAITSRGLTVIEDGTSQPPTVVAVGPMLDPVVEATRGLDIRVVYTPIVKPWDPVALRTAVTGTDVIVVEPYLAGTSVRYLADALSDRPQRFLGIGVGEAELHRYGSPEDHDTAHGLDAAGIRRRIEAFVRIPDAPGVEVVRF